MFDTIVTAPGSLGDVNPMIAIARGLQSLGRNVIMVAAQRYLPLAERAGLATRSLISEEVFSRAIDDPRMWHPRKGLQVIFGAAGQGFLEEHYAWLQSLYQPGKMLLVSHVLDFAGRTFRDAHPDVPFCSVVPAPALLRSLTRPPRLSRWGIETRLPRFLLAMAYRQADRIIDSMAAPAVNRLRSSIGLSPVSSILGNWWISPDLTLGLFPDWFSIPQGDLPPGLTCVGFPLADSGDLLPSDADQLINEALRPLGADAPIVFAPGSAHSHAAPFLAAAAEACRRTGFAGLLLSSVQDQFPDNLPPNVVTANYLPFRHLLLKARAIVHHGGVGTTSQSFAAGLPQLVTPMAFDQFDNADRVRRLGCGRWLPMTSAHPTKLARELQLVLSDEKMEASAKRIAGQMSHHACTPEFLAKTILDRIVSP